MKRNYSECCINIGCGSNQVLKDERSTTDTCRVGYISGCYGCMINDGSCNNGRDTFINGFNYSNFLITSPIDAPSFEENRYANYFYKQNSANSSPTFTLNSANLNSNYKDIIQGVGCGTYLTTNELNEYGLYKYGSNFICKRIKANENQSNCNSSGSSKHDRDCDINSKNDGKIFKAIVKCSSLTISKLLENLLDGISNTIGKEGASIIGDITLINVVFKDQNSGEQGTFKVNSTSPVISNLLQGIFNGLSSIIPDIISNIDHINVHFKNSTNFDDKIYSNSQYSINTNDNDKNKIQSPIKKQIPQPTHQIQQPILKQPPQPTKNKQQIKYN